MTKISLALALFMVVWFSMLYFALDEDPCVNVRPIVTMQDEYMALYCGRGSG